MSKTFRVDVTDAQYKALAWRYVNPHQSIDDFITNRIQEAMMEIATREITRRLADPNWTDPIPADKMRVFDTLILKSALQLQQESTARMKIMVQDADAGAAIPVPTHVSVKPDA
jgi:hypothetical protein